MHLFPKISLSIIAAVCAVISQTNYLRPLPPQIESVTVNSSNEVTIQIEPVRSDSFTDYKYHAVLVSDLSISLEKAFEAGKDKQRGTWISGTLCPTAW